MNKEVSKEQVKNEVKKVESKLPDIGKTALSRMIGQVEEFAKIENTPLTVKEKTYATNIASAIIKRVEEAKVSWSLVDVKDVVGQIKRFARLGLSINENELYIDMRNNGKTGLKDITIKKQYQGIEKELIKWCSKKIVRFYKDVVCKGDVFETEVDFETGLEKVVKHAKDKTVDRNKLDNIVGAYNIAYVEENDKLVQYLVVIDRNRIMRAYNASPTNEKPIWKADTQRMVIKTTVWSLYNYILKPYMNIPEELKQDWELTQDEMDLNNVEEIVVEEVNTYANTGEVLDIPDELENEEEDESEHQPEQFTVEETPKPKSQPKPQDQPNLFDTTPRGF